MEKLYSAEDILLGVNKLENVIDIDELQLYQTQISAAIGLSLDFFNQYQTFLLSERRRSNTTTIAVNITPMQGNKTVAVASTPEDLIARVCQSLQHMHSLISGDMCTYCAFSAVVADLVGCVSLVADMTASSPSATSVSTRRPPQNIQHLTRLPAQVKLFLPATDELEQLMSIFGHFKNTMTMSARTLDNNVVILKGHSGNGKSSLANVFAHRSSRLKKYDFIRWMPMDSSECARCEWLSLAHMLHLRVHAQMSLSALVEHVTRRLQKNTYLLIMDGVNSIEEVISLSSIWNPPVAGTSLFPVANQHILITSSLQYQWPGAHVASFSSAELQSLSAGQRKRISEGCYTPYDKTLINFTCSSTLLYFQKSRPVELLQQHSTATIEGESSDIFTMHSFFDGLPMGVTHFVQIYFLVKETQSTLSIKSFWEQFQQRVSGMSTSPTTCSFRLMLATVACLWDILMEHIEQVYSGEVRTGLAVICQVMSIFRGGSLISKKLFDDSLRRVCALNANSCSDTPLALGIALKAQWLTEQDEYYVLHPLLPSILLMCLFHINYPLNEFNDAICQDVQFDFHRLVTGVSPSQRLVDVLSSCRSALGAIVGESLDAMPFEEVPFAFAEVSECASSSSSSGACAVFPDVEACELLPHVEPMRDIASLTLARFESAEPKDTDTVKCVSHLTFSLSVLRVQICLLLRSFEEALTLCEELAAQHTSHLEFPSSSRHDEMGVEFTYCLASARAGSGHSSAVAMLQKLIESTPPSQLLVKWLVRSHVQLAAIRMSEHNDRSAMESFEKALSVMKDHVELTPLRLFASVCLQASGLLFDLARFKEGFALLDGVKVPLVCSQRVQQLYVTGVGLAKNGSEDTKALEVFEAALKVTDSLYGSYSAHLSVVNILRYMGVVLTTQHKYTRALAVLERSLAAHQVSICCEYSNGVGSTLTCIGDVFLAQGEQRRALDRYCAALEQYQDQESVELAHTLSRIAKVYATQGKFVDALSQYKIVLGLQSRVLPRSHRTIALTLRALGQTCESLGRYKEALGQYNAALVMEKKCYATEVHMEIAETCHCIGHTYSLEQEYDSALVHYEKALVIKKLLCGSDHIEVASTLNHMGNLHKYRGQYDMALALHREVLQLKKKTHGEDSPSLQTTVEILGKLSRIESIKGDAVRLFTEYIERRKHESRISVGSVGFSKDSKVEAATFLLQHVKDNGLERFSDFSKVVGYHRHKGAIENGRLGKNVEKIRLAAFTNF